jgi:hypothetical protein
MEPIGTPDTGWREVQQLNWLFPDAALNPDSEVN